jgi:hypothetical protein
MIFISQLEPSVAGISYSENVCVFGVAWKPGTILYSNLLKIEKKCLLRNHWADLIMIS